MYYIVIQFLSELYTLQNNTKIYGHVISNGGLISKAQFLCSMQENTNWYWKHQPPQQTIICPSRTIIHARLDVITIQYVQDIPKNICNRIQSKTSIERHPTGMTDADSDYILDEIECREKLSLNRMRVLILARNSTYDNNHNAILYVVFHYRVIKYQYVNIIWIFIFFSVFSLLLDSVMFIPLECELVPKCI